MVFGNMTKLGISRNPGMAGRELAPWGMILGIIVLVLPRVGLLAFMFVLGQFIRPAQPSRLVNDLSGRHKARKRGRQ